ncbi:MAG: 50S ribosomal protein L10 [Clostridia bacterium]|nr:50S ribosomal protein L10 [Clostridia bacterium]
MPSANVLEQKKQLVANLVDRMKNSVAGVIVCYQGITVENDTALRAELRKAGVEYSVIKNTLTKKACEEVGYGKLGEVLEGMTAVATSAEDPVAAAKILKKYADKVEHFELKAGYVDGEVLDAAGVTALAELPSKEQLVAKMLGSLQSSLYGLAYVLQAYIDKQNEETAA